MYNKCNIKNVKNIYVKSNVLYYTYIIIIECNVRKASTWSV